MNKLFPPMHSKPEKIKIFALIPCWIWVFVLFPMFMPFVGLGLWSQWEISDWLEIFYHVANGVGLLWLMFSYLKDDWFMVSVDFRHFLKHIALTVGLVMGVELLLLGTLYVCGFNIINMLECLPVAEMFVSHTPLFLISLEPIFGTIALSVFAPISICALFYCLGFAPICYKKPLFAYLCIAVITLIPPIINIIWRGGADLVLSGYFVQLPVHLLMCWSYQKTDNIWTPMISLSITNLLMSIALHIFVIV
ncbi:MAG: hypothetical protein E7611_07230 [Ruminococcaceae bacterium]|nr:hypothetical protein [Oscillospiraceae bacterium]